ncbi:MAG: hypothetical protein HOV71_23735 [Hamadaea sp.]|nr:hypothetical protein [Hamadaea sp.]NUR51148.1 hypothetical protein [Hamadaea sp.]NUT03558.1 hypothetical protein [Hamadaea sp.]
MSTASISVATGSPPRGVVVLLVLQSTLISAFYLGVGGLYLTVSAKAGWPGWLGPENDPKDHWPVFLWSAYPAIMLSAVVGHVFAAALVPAGLWTLAQPHVRRRPRLAWTLAATTALCAGMVVLIMTPLGQHIQYWMLD